MAGGSGTTYKGYTIPHNKRWHTVAGKGLCAVMWYQYRAAARDAFWGFDCMGSKSNCRISGSRFWVFYRAKQDGAVLLGLRHPWDGHDDHSNGHGHKHETSSSSSSSH